MAEMDKQIEELIAAWKLASERLGIRVLAPFDFRVDAISYSCVAHLPDFGGPKGMLLQAMFPPKFTTDEELANDAKKAGYYMSFINPNVYSESNLDEFKDTLKDWGFYGPPASCPEWMKGQGDIVD
jgi:hypothetical protein